MLSLMGLFWQPAFVRDFIIDTSALGVSHVMRYINAQYLLTYLLTICMFFGRIKMLACLLAV